MSTRESLLRYVHIINKLRKYPSSFVEIDKFLTYQSELQGYNFNVSKRQFQRDLANIASIFEIEITYDQKKLVYCINNDELSEISQRRMEAFDTFNALKIGENISKSIHFEKRQPQGTENMFGLLHAIKNHLQIGFTYSKFWEDEPTERVAEPYALKEFKNRWYVLVNDLKDSTIKSFALDRLSELEITKKHFTPPVDFDVTEHYKHCFGIISPTTNEPEEVILSFNQIQGKYIKSLPLHDTQEILIDTKEELRIKLTIFITFDFIMELLSFGENVKVMEPNSLIKKIKKSYKRASDQYKNFK
jgi:predicted DNA-binding transcriptional regulator YafY